MAKFSVLVSALENEKSKYNSYKGELSSYSSKINSAKNVLPIYSPHNYYQMNYWNFFQH